MTREEAIKHLKLMQSGARNAIRFTKNDKEISEEERKEDIEIYQDQLVALNMAINFLEQEPCEDAVSRKAVLEYIERSDAELGHSSENKLVCQDIKEFPSVTPTRCIVERKKGKWVLHTYMPHKNYCSECEKNSPYNKRWDFCPNCGAKMEVEE